MPEGLHTPESYTPGRTKPDRRFVSGIHSGQPNSTAKTSNVASGRRSTFESQELQRRQEGTIQRRGADAHNSTRSSRLQSLQMSTPITPSNDSSNLDRHALFQRPREHFSFSSCSVITPEMENVEFSQTLSPQPEGKGSLDDDLGGTSVVDTSSASSISSQAEEGSQQRLLRFHSRPNALDTGAAQDASLPSPSLSPVTAAANLQNRRSYFDDVDPMHQRLSKTFRQGSRKDDVNSRKTPPKFQSEAPASTRPSLMDMPILLESFEAMPLEMKTYMMYQLLRRCPKNVLHFVADNVNPALKCDFLNLLPPELTQNIIRHLDLKSLCRASRVSRKWRQVIDGDEKIWKDLFDAEGFVLPSAELQRAISEGWGWQHGSDPNDYERDIGSIAAKKADLFSPLAAEMGNMSEHQSNTIVETPKRPKRKANQKVRTPNRKHQKRNQSAVEEPALFDTSSLKRHLEEADGPYAAAQAAFHAVPNPNIGLPSLRHMHLYKSIYRRHYQISLNWMQDKIKPRHLAFKAHQRHVVTCLQFDDERILTGSDDTNINVYDTRTGALRARLEGHEGGVWALQYEGPTLVSGSTDRSVRIWDIDKGVCTHVFLGHTSTVRCLIILKPTEIGKTASGRPIIMPKEPIIVTGSRDSTLRVWKLPKPADPPSLPSQEENESPYFVRALLGHGHSVRAIAAHGDTLISGSYDSTVRVWKISTGETLHRLQGHNSKVYSVVLDHERNQCISGSMDSFVKIWSLDSGNLIHTLEGHSSLVGLLDLQRNRLVSAAADYTLRIWDPESGHCRNELRAHTGAITCFQHDGRKVISGADQNLKMWNVQTGAFIRNLLTDLSGVWQVKFDERRCVAAVQREGLTYIEVSYLVNVS